MPTTISINISIIFSKIIIIIIIIVLSIFFTISIIIILCIIITTSITIIFIVFIYYIHIFIALFLVKMLIMCCFVWLYHCIAFQLTPLSHTKDMHMIPATIGNEWKTLRIKKKLYITVELTPWGGELKSMPCTQKLMPYWHNENNNIKSNDDETILIIN